MDIEDQNIYNIRLRVDEVRQPRHKHAFKQMQDTLALLEPPKSHPYSLDKKDYDQLNKKLADDHPYKQRCCGLAGEMEGMFCYHITSIWKIRYFSLEFVNKQFAGETDETGFRFLLEECKQKKGDWLSFAEYFGGKYTGPRRLTWWTTLELPGADLMCSGHQLGLLNKGVPPQAIILRCPTSYVLKKSLVFVPCLLDAFFSRIFHATMDSVFPKSGMTINLERPENLTLGVQEYVIPPIAIADAKIEFLPVDLRIKSRHDVHLEDVLPFLAPYYETLGRGITAERQVNAE